MSKQYTDVDISKAMEAATEMAPSMHKTLFAMAETHMRLMQDIEDLEQVEANRAGRVVIERHLAALRDLRGFTCWQLATSLSVGIQKATMRPR